MGNVDVLVEQYISTSNVMDVLNNLKEARKKSKNKGKGVRKQTSGKGVGRHTKQDEKQHDQESGKNCMDYLTCQATPKNPLDKLADRLNKGDREVILDRLIIENVGVTVANPSTLLGMGHSGTRFALGNIHRENYSEDEVGSYEPG